MPNYGYLLLFRKYLHGGLPVPELLVTCPDLGCLPIQKKKKNYKKYIHGCLPVAELPTTWVELGCLPVKTSNISPWLFVLKSMWFTSKNLQNILMVSSYGVASHRYPSCLFIGKVYLSVWWLTNYDLWTGAIITS